ncbi:hypothetical protein [Micromonospora sp. NBS 11-29]|uniref:hypothetical protein n=1 Tax=Micromonospora sp. NBS 11-29 TaxID=1960879 RepID=UPI0020CF491F|nr:hypothetical protein [Micromonospora sp. NBS 11-29]
MRARIRSAASSGVPTTQSLGKRLRALCGRPAKNGQSRTTGTAPLAAPSTSAQWKLSRSEVLRMTPTSVSAPGTSSVRPVRTTAPDASSSASSASRSRTYAATAGLSSGLSGSPTSLRRYRSSRRRSSRSTAKAQRGSFASELNPTSPRVNRLSAETFGATYRCRSIAL